LVPLTPTENAVVFPEQTDILEGCEVIEGGRLTVNVAEFEVAAGVQLPVMMQRY
jgi:hypothetical protein